MGGEFSYNPDVSTNPEHGKDLEIEVKIVNLGDPSLLIKKLETAGAILKIPKRRLRDVNFNLQESALPSLNKPAEIQVVQTLNAESLEKMLGFLGFNIISKSKSALTVNRTLPPERRALRIRNDGEKYTWTAKTPRVKNSSHDERIEINVDINKSDDAVEILNTLGYAQSAVSEKDRITYSLDGCLVEINYGPTAPAWGEVEGPDKESIFKVAAKLGFSETDLASMSDGDYYKMHGVKKEERRNMTFENFKNSSNE